MDVEFYLLNMAERLPNASLPLKASRQIWFIL
jgi:hypothetical protein